LKGRDRIELIASSTLVSPERIARTASQIGSSTRSSLARATAAAAE
jgi:hypothetical protein